MRRCTHGSRAELPGDGPVHHARDARPVAPLGQDLSHGLGGRHTAGGGQLPLHRPLFGGAGEHRGRRVTGEHFGRHVVLGASEHQPEEEMMVQQDRERGIERERERERERESESEREV